MFYKMNNINTNDIFENILIPNKKKFYDFYHKCIKTNSLNILLYGTRESCKTSIIDAIIKNFSQQQNKKLKENQFIFRCNPFDEINLQMNNNIMNIFCQNNVNCSKIVYIDKFEFFSESNQQLLKIYIDKYNGAKVHNKVFFIIETNQIEKVKDVIKSRFNVFNTLPLESIHYKSLFEQRLSEEQMTIDQKALNHIVHIPNMCISEILNIVNKSKLLNFKHITFHEVRELSNFINYQAFDAYFDNILENNDIKRSSNILIELIEDGYDISDVYFFMYEYIKTQNKHKLYCIIDIICYYINEIYNGNHNKIMLVILTYEIQQKLQEENNSSI